MHVLRKQDHLLQDLGQGGVVLPAGESQQMEDGGLTLTLTQPGHSRVHALGDGGHDEEDGLGHLPGRVAVFQRGVELRRQSW